MTTVTIREAALRKGVHRDAIQRAARLGELDKVAIPGTFKGEHGIIDNERFRAWVPFKQRRGLRGDRCADNQQRKRPEGRNHGR